MPDSIQSLRKRMPKKQTIEFFKIFRSALNCFIHISSKQLWVTFRRHGGGNQTPDSDSMISKTYVWIFSEFLVFISRFDLQMTLNLTQWTLIELEFWFRNLINIYVNFFRFFFLPLTVLSYITLKAPWMFSRRHDRVDKSRIQIQWSQTLMYEFFHGYLSIWPSYDLEPDLIEVSWPSLWDQRSKKPWILFFVSRAQA